MAVILNSEHKVHTHLFNPLQHGDKDTDCSEDVEQHRVRQVRALDCAPTMANMKRDEGSYGKRFVTGPGQKQVHPIHIITCAYRQTEGSVYLIYCGVVLHGMSTWYLQAETWYSSSRRCLWANHSYHSIPGELHPTRYPITLDRDDQALFCDGFIGAGSILTCSERVCIGILYLILVAKTRKNSSKICKSGFGLCCHCWILALDSRGFV
eukprot:185160_1